MIRKTSGAEMAGEREPGTPRTPGGLHISAPDPKSPPTPEQEPRTDATGRSGAGGSNHSKPVAAGLPPSDGAQTPEPSPHGSGVANRTRPAANPGKDAAGWVPHPPGTAWTPAEQARHRAQLWRAIDGRGPAPSPPFAHRPRPPCPACRAGIHGGECEGNGCLCRCRAMLGLEGPFQYGDSTATGLHDVPDPNEEWVT